ncbi:type 1 fimbria pilin [Variovorax boronicumulans]|uniref:Type 1 fimbria pilin n=1 Tax=Variovorax boronicumulans TaxID=436515 RepID=A0AAW8DQJ3_9BURK|nr:fimbrial protein [Variovorax boronicumulans]MDP9876459.1 type 1 fimbria pilin [Variovorax boronicumulans]MDP9921743.1 type 1 fimbria pilin [Variovorax boronicumulans]
MKLILSREPSHSWMARLACCLRSAWVVVLLSMVATVSMAQASDSMLRGGTLVAFSNNITLPSLAPKGAIVARHYITPQQLCGQPKCSFWRVAVYPKNGGGVEPAGVALTETNVSGISAQLLINGVPQSTVDTGNVNVLAVETSSMMEVQLIRDGRSLKGGPFLGGSSSSTTGWQLVPLGLNTAPGNPFFIDLKGSSVSVIPGTCRATNQTVTLAPSFVTGFTGPGSTFGKRAFEVRLENCPPGFNQVGHVLTAIGGEVPGFPGALKPAAGSTATGVAIRLTDASDAPATFGRSLPVTSYNKATGGSATVPMHASYVQTGATVTPGSVKGAVQVLLDYQ